MTRSRSRHQGCHLCGSPPSVEPGWYQWCMGSEPVDQIGPDGALVKDVDPTLSRNQKRDLLFDALPGAWLEHYADRWVVRFGIHILLTKQVTHLGRPWETYKKRIQIPRYWLDIWWRG